MDATPIIIKKKKAHAHAHHGGSWKVAYADFVTAMMAFFMVMWIMGLSEDTKSQIQGYFNDPIGFVKNQPKSKSVLSPKNMPYQKPGQEKATPFKEDQKAMKALKNDLEKALAATPELSKFLEHIEIDLTEEGLRIEFLEDKNDFFESASAVLKPGALKVIRALGPKVAASGRAIGIEGHTDSVPFGSDKLGNFRLSSMRALALQEELGKSGVAYEKFKYAKGLADNELRDADHPTSAINRRVTLLLPFSANATSTEAMPKDAVRDLVSPSIKPSIKMQPQEPDVVHLKN